MDMKWCVQWNCAELRADPVNATVLDLMCRECLTRTFPHCHLVIPHTEERALGPEHTD